MAGYIGKSQGVTQVDGYNRTEADDRYVNASGDTMTGDLTVAQGASLVKAFSNNTEEYLVKGTDQSAFQPYISHTPSFDTPERGFRFGVWDNNGTKTDWLKIWNGRVTMPYQPAFSATGASGGNVSVSNPTALSLQSTHFNRGNHYNTSTSKFTAPVSGIYQFNIVTYLNSDTATVVFLVNDAQIGSADTDNLLFKTTASPYTMAMSICATLAANDTVSVSSRAGSGSTTFYIGHTTFSGFLIG